MRRFRSGMAVGVAGVLGCLLVAACGTTEAGGGGDTSSAPGLTKDKLVLGALTDISGPFAANDIQQNESVDLYWKQRNADGGVCGRQVEVVSRDHGYDPQKAVSLFSSIKNDVFALQTSDGSGTTMAISQLLAPEDMAAVAGSWAPEAAQSKNLIVTGTTGDVTMVNAADYAIEKEGLSKGDTVGILHFQGSYGEPELAGLKYVAEKHGLTVSAQQVAPTSADLTAEVGRLSSAKAKAVFVVAAPAQLLSFAAVSEASGYKVPIYATIPAFSVDALTSNARDAMLTRVHVVGLIQPWSSDSEGPSDLRKLYEADGGTDSPSLWRVLGYVHARVLDEILQEACEDGELSREGLLKKLADVDVDTGSAVVPLQFRAGQHTPGQAANVMKPEADVEGGLSLVEGDYVGPDVEGFLAK